jgi:hypothetical protein
MQSDTVYSVEDFLGAVGNAKAAGVYALLEGERVVFVGLSRNAAASVRLLQQKSLIDTVDAVRMQTFAFPRRSEMQVRMSSLACPFFHKQSTRAQSFREAWIADLGYVPIGNEQQWHDDVREVS